MRDKIHGTQLRGAELHATLELLEGCCELLLLRFLLRPAVGEVLGVDDEAILGRGLRHHVEVYMVDMLSLMSLATRSVSVGHLERELPVILQRIRLCCAAGALPGAPG